MKKLKSFLFIILLSLFLFSQSDEWKSALRKISEGYLFIKSYSYKTPEDELELSYSAIRGILSSLDPHSYLLDPSNFKTMREDQKGKFYGIGIQIYKFEDRLTVMSPLEGTPAYRLGIQAGDVITHINGEPTKNLSLNEAVRKLRGPKGTEVKITIKREGVKTPLHFTIKRAEIPLQSIPYSFKLPWGEKTGVIVIRSFTTTTKDEFDKAIKKLRDKNISSLILDLRYNSGGALVGAIEIADEFLKKGKPIVVIKGREKYLSKTFYAEKNNQCEDLKLAILINRGSASASEIVAGAIQDNKRGVVVGETSWGKGLVQTIFPIAEDTAIALTTARYYSPSGRRIQRDYSHLEDYLFFYDDQENPSKGGITPDIVVKGKEIPIGVVKMRAKGLFFSYATHIGNRKTFIGKYLKFYKKDKKIKMAKRYYSIYKFLPDDKIFMDFYRFILARKFKISKKIYKKLKKDVKKEIAREIIIRVWGNEEGYIYSLTDDPQFKKAVEAIK